MEAKDRLKALLASLTLNGIDFVEVASTDQKTLRVHFLNTFALQGKINKVEITGGETIRTVLVNSINDTTDWAVDAEGRPVLTLTVATPGDFSFYTLKLNSNSNALDPFFDHVTFSFKALCPSDLDCAPPAPVCPLEPGDVPPIDSLAKDFLSFRKALSDFSALRYPEWQERSEADFGMMFMEALCSLADDLSYTQDRIAAEATLDTATQRRSIVRHARLVDYEPRPATSARVLLQLDVQSSVTSLPPGLVVSAQGPDGRSIDFETGTGLVDPKTGQFKRETLTVNAAWNRSIQPYYLDDSQRCLKAGSTEMWVAGDSFNFVTDTNAGPGKGQTLLIDTEGATSADPRIREIVHLFSADPETDPLFPTPPPNPQPTPITHIVFRAEDTLKSDHDLTKTVLAGNLILATQGRRYTETFAIEKPSTASPQMPLAIVRVGSNNTPDDPSDLYLYTLQNSPMAWLAQDDPDALPLPEIVLAQQPIPPSTQQAPWTWRRRLLEAVPFEPAFTVDPVRFRRIARNSNGTFMQDYDGDGGNTIRFGDGIFGDVPERGAIFQVTYRVGGGTIGNVAADSITKVDPATAALVLAVTNPFAAKEGADKETDEQVRRLAPQAFRARQFRAVRREDYEKAAETLPWVLRAGTAFRWTGSWLTVFTTADPRGSEAITIDEHRQLIELLNRYRLAGYESYVPSPQYVSLDLLVTVCAQPDAFRGDVESAVLSALSTSKFVDGTTGFFFFDNFTFGTPLERSALEAAIQKAYGVAGVVSIKYRQRGVIPVYVEIPDEVQVHADQILRMDNDPSRPERGSLKVRVEGGK
jgi:hypothetical protein